MPIRTRREVLSLAQRYRVPIVEDATYRDLYFNERAAAVAARARRSQPGDLLEQLLEGDGAGPAARLDCGGAVDRRSDRDHQAAARSAHAEPGAVRDRAADAAGQRSTRTCGRCAPSTRKRCTQMVATHPAAHAAGRDPVRAAGRAGCISGAAWRRASAHGAARARARGRRGVRTRARRSTPIPRATRELRLCFTSVLPQAMDESIRGWRPGSKPRSSVGRRRECPRSRATRYMHQRALNH